jgi:hypothetical protein
MNIRADVADYNEALAEPAKSLCDALLEAIEASLPDAEAKVWHGHPVWFLNENPLVGYSQQKAGVQLLFWSGKSFSTVGLEPVGKHQAAGLTLKQVADLDQALLAGWLKEAREIQWDYANVVKRRSLEKLTDF